MADRQGLNCTLSYRSDGTHTYRVRVSMLTHGLQVIYAESQARIRRSFYPHRLSSAQFGLQVDLKGEEEYVSFSSWLATYASAALTLDSGADEFPSMAVSLPSRNFLRKGVPLRGYEWGDQVGKMLWSPMIVFETSEEPVDLGKDPAKHSFAVDSIVDQQARYYYPTGNQLSGNGAPPDGTYAKVVTALDLINANAGLSDDLNNERRSGRGGRGA